MKSSAGPVTAVLYADVSFDNRVLREATTLADSGLDVRLVCAYPPRRRLDELPGGVRVEVVAPVAAAMAPGALNPTRRPSPPRSRWLVGGRARRHAEVVAWAVAYVRGVRAWGARVRRLLPDTAIWHAHDLPGLVAIGSCLSGAAVPVVYDSHELYLESGTAAKMPAPARALMRAYERCLARRAAAWITVNDGIRAELQRAYGIQAEVVMNCPPRPREGVVGLLRDRLGLGLRPTIVYHGAIGVHRGIEVVLRALPLVPDAVFVIIGEGAGEASMRTLATELGLGHRVHFLPMVDPSELRGWLVDADVGVVLFEPTERNHILASPNKLFEYFNAGVPVLASDFPVMRGLLRRTGAGVVCDPRSTSDVAVQLSEMLDPTTRALMGSRALAAAMGEFNWETQGAKLLSVYRRLAQPNVTG